MVLVRDGSAGNRDDSVAGAPDDLPLAPVDDFDHEFQRSIDDRARLKFARVIPALVR
jgi:hypothetical protein